MSAARSNPVAAAGVATTPTRSSGDADATYTTASETELRRRMVEGDRYAKAELARRSQRETKLPPHEQEAIDRLKVELGAVEVAA